MTRRKSVLERLTGVFWAHLREHPALPEPCTVTLDPCKPEIEVQAAPAGSVAHVGELLLWAYTLTGVTARWWRTPNEGLHITIKGRAADTRFRVYGGIIFADCAGLARLEVNESESVSVDELYTLRELLRDKEADAAEVIA
jgi:hypothetical protein